MAGGSGYRLRHDRRTRRLALQDAERLDDSLPKRPEQRGIWCWSLHWQPGLEGDKLRVLAVYAEERLPGELASVPTAKEQGFNLVWPIIRGFYLGPKVSEAEYQWWIDTFKTMTATEEFKQQRDLRGLFEFNLTGKELDTYVKNQVTQYREQAKAFGLAK